MAQETAVNWSDRLELINELIFISLKDLTRGTTPEYNQCSGPHSRDAPQVLSVFRASLEGSPPRVISVHRLTRGTPPACYQCSAPHSRDAPRVLSVFAASTKESRQNLTINIWRASKFLPFLHFRRNRYIDIFDNIVNKMEITPHLLLFTHVYQRHVNNDIKININNSSS